MLSLYLNIRKLREARGWSQTDLAKKTGYSGRSAISRIESGQIDLPQSQIMKFAEVFGVPAGDLMGMDGVVDDAKDAALIRAYHDAPYEIQFAVERLLGLRE